MITKRAHLFIIFILIGIPILFQISGKAGLQSAVSVIAQGQGPNLYLEKNEVLRPIPKYSSVKLIDGREGLYLWVYQNEVHLELKDDKGKVMVSPDQISQVMLHDFNVPLATIGLGLLTGSVFLFATTTKETEIKEATRVTYFDEELGEEVTAILPGGYSETINYYPENAIAFGAVWAIAGGYLAHRLKKRSTFSIGTNDWQLNIVDSY